MERTSHSVERIIRSTAGTNDSTEPMSHSTAAIRHSRSRSATPRSDWPAPWSDPSIPWNDRFIPSPGRSIPGCDSYFHRCRKKSAGSNQTPPNSQPRAVRGIAFTSRKALASCLTLSLTYAVAEFVRIPRCVRILTNPATRYRQRLRPERHLSRSNSPMLLRSHSTQNSRRRSGGSTVSADGKQRANLNPGERQGVSPPSGSNRKRSEA